MRTAQSRRIAMPAATSSFEVRRPTPARSSSEDVIRPALEWARLVRDPLFWGWTRQRGDGRRVLVLPGLMGGDAYLSTIRGWLRRVGYQPVESGLRRNPGWSQELVDEFGALVTQRRNES